MKRAMFPTLVNPNVERMSTDAEQGAAVVGESLPSFFEPFAVTEFGDVINNRGDIVVDIFGTNLEHLGATATEQYMRRIVACVNACHYIPTENLEKIAGMMGTTPRLVVRN